MYSEMDEIEIGLLRIINSKNNDTLSKITIIEEILKQVDDENFDIHFGRADENILLESAIKNGEVDIVQLLVVKGAKSKKVDLTCNVLVKRHNDETSYEDDNICDKQTVIKKEPKTISKYMVNCQFQVDKIYDVLEERKCDTMFKILNLTKCREYADFINLISDIDFWIKFDNTTHAFFIRLEVDSMSTVTYILSHIEIIECDIKKPLIVQVFVNDTNENFICYKESGDTRLIVFRDVEQLTEEEFLKSVEQQRFNFVLLLRAIHSGIAGYYNGDLLSVKFDISKLWNKNRLIDYAILHTDVLSLRFMMLTDWKLHMQNGNKLRALEIATEKGNPEILSALLDLPIEGGLDVQMIRRENTHLLHMPDVNGENLLMIAARQNIPSIITFLIQCGINIYYRSKQKNEANVSDIAWSKKNYENLITILKADGFFPEDYDSSALKQSNEVEKELFEYATEVELLHEAIGNGDQTTIKKFREMHPTITKAYNIYNKTAYETAIETNSTMCDLLTNEGFQTEDKYLQSQYAKYLRKLKTKFFAKPDSHVSFLLHRTRFESELRKNDSYAKVKKFYEDLDEIPEISIILKVISLCETLDIVFDFNNDSTVNLSPTTNSKTKAICVYLLGRIYVGAKKLIGEDGNVMGHFAHEATHLAMQMIYQNNTNPFRKADLERKSIFSKVIASCYYKYLKHCVDDETNDMEEIIQVVFEYLPGLWSLELIVRVPHLIAFYSKADIDKMAKIKKEFKDLFSFYYDHTEKDMEDFLSNSDRYQSTTLIASLNKMLGKLQHYMAQDIKLTNTLNGVMNCPNMIVYISNIPQLIIHNILQTLKAYLSDVQIDGSWIIVSADQLEYFSDKISEAQRNYHASVIIDCSNINEAELQIIQGFEGNDLILVFKDEERDFLRCILSKSQKIEYSWDKLTTDTKTKLLEKEVTFQNHFVKISDLINQSSVFPYDLFLADLVQRRSVVIGNACDFNANEDKLYVQRNYVPPKASKLRNWDCSSGDEDDNENYDVEITSKTFFATFMERQGILIYDKPGMGKTTELKKINRKLKEMYPKHWILLIDLKTYYEAFQNFFQDQENSILDFFLKTFIEKTKYNHALFRHLFDTGLVVVLMDGFDEICPSVKHVVLNLIKEIVEKTQNQMLVSTRPHFVEELGVQINFASFHLKPFTKENRSEFVRKFFKDKHFSDETVIQIIYKIETFNKRYSVSMSHPLLLKMTLELFEEKPNLNLSSLNKYLLYKRFVKEKNTRTMKKGTEAKNSVERQMGNSKITKFYQFHALRIIAYYDSDTYSKLKLIKDVCFDDFVELELDDVARVGLMYYDGQHFHFTHRTFGEFFLASFLFEMIAEKKLTEENFKPILGLLLEILTERSHFHVHEFLMDAFEKFNFKQNQRENVTLKNAFMKFDHDEGFIVGLIRRRVSFRFVKIIVLYLVDNFEQWFTRPCDSSDENILHLGVNCWIDTEMLANICQLCIDTCGVPCFCELLQSENKDGNVLHFAAAQHNLNAFKYFIAAFQSYLPSKFMQIFIGQNIYDRNIWSSIGRKGRILDFSIDLIDKTFNINEIKGWLLTEGPNAIKEILIQMEDNFNFEVFWNLCEKNLTVEEQKKMLLLKDDSIGVVAVHYATVHTSASNFKFIAQLYRKLFENDSRYDLKNIFFCKKWCEWWCSQILNFDYYLNRIGTIREVWFFLQSLFSDDKNKLVQYLKGYNDPSIFTLVKEHAVKTRTNKFLSFCPDAIELADLITKFVNDNRLNS